MKILFDNEHFAVTRSELRCKISSVGLSPVPVFQLLKPFVFHEHIFYELPLTLRLHPLINPAAMEQGFRMAIHHCKDELSEAVDSERLNRTFRTAEVISCPLMFHRRAPASLFQRLSWVVQAERTRRGNETWTFS